MNHPAIANPLPIRERQRGLDRSAATAKACRREPAVDDREMPAVPFRLIGDLSPELAEGGIGETLGQLGSRQAFEVQVLDADPLVLRDQVRRQLMEEVLSPIGDLVVNPGDAVLGLAVPLAPLNATGRVALGALLLLLSLAIELRSGRPLAVGEDGEVL